MAFDGKSLDDYVDVAQRVAEFRDHHPEGSLQPADPAKPYHVVSVPAPWCQQCIGRRTVKSGRDSWKTCSRCGGTGLRSEGEPAEDVFIVYAAAAYRTPDDPRPGIGQAWEPYPGRTPYTAASELMNAETSAWGRAIQAALAADAKKGMASREEVRNRAAENGHDPGGPQFPVTDRDTGLIPGRPVTTLGRPAPGRGADMTDEIRSEERPGSYDPVDMRAIGAMYYGKLGFDSRTDELHVVHTSEQLLKKTITGSEPGKSLKNLSWRDARELRRQLAGFRGDRAALLAHLAGITRRTEAVAAQDAAEGSQETPEPADA